MRRRPPPWDAGIVRGLRLRRLRQRPDAALRAAGLLGTLYPADYNAYALPANALLRLLATGLFELRYRNALRSEPLRRLGAAGPGRLLDVGSGRGDLGLVLQRRGWRVVGLEPSERACIEARQRGVPTEMGTLTEAPMLEAPFDAIVFNHSLEHVVEPLADLGRARELISDGGLLLVLVPNFGSWQRRNFGTYWFHLDLPRHRSHLTATGLTRLFERAGLTTVALGTATSADGLPMSVQYKAFGRRRLDHGVGRYGALAATLALLPATMLANRVAGSGDILYGIARASG